MGLVIAREATLIHDPLSEPKPYYVRGIYTGSTERMLRIIIEEVKKVKYDAEILAATLTNFRFKTVYSRKLKPGVSEPSVVLEETPKIATKLRD